MLSFLYILLIPTLMIAPIHTSGKLISRLKMYWITRDHLRPLSNIRRRTSESLFTPLPPNVDSTLCLLLGSGRIYRRQPRPSH